MSALPPKADIGERSWDVRFVPIADIAHYSITSPARAHGQHKTLPFQGIKSRFARSRLLGPSSGDGAILIPDYIAIALLILMLVWAVAAQIRQGKS
jgi:hypothetical protein